MSSSVLELRRLQREAGQISAAAFRRIAMLLDDDLSHSPRARTLRRRSSEGAAQHPSRLRDLVPRHRVRCLRVGAECKCSAPSPRVAD
eukprot:scaffold123245_cov32-Tisochrysis_lutea.AAC.3